MSKLSNDQNIKNLEKRKKLRILIIIFATITIVFALLTIVTQFFDVGFRFSVVFSLITYIITLMLSKKRNSIEIIISDELESIRKEIKNDKLEKKKKRKKK